MEDATILGTNDESIPQEVVSKDGRTFTVKVNPNRELVMKKLIPIFIQYLDSTAAENISALDLARVAVDGLMKRYIYEEAKGLESVRNYLLRVTNNEPWCWLCNMRIFMDTPPNAQTAFSMDHIKPKSSGGQMTRENILPAHRWCNSSRHANPTSEKSKERHERRRAKIMEEIRGRMIVEGIPFRDAPEPLADPQRVILAQRIIEEIAA